MNRSRKQRGRMADARCEHAYRGSGFSPTSPALPVGPKPDQRPDEVSARERVWQVVAAIPAGRVASYGQVAALAGIPRGARFVGGVLRELPDGSRLPWHRVLNARGRLSVDPLTAREQRERLESEGVAFLCARVDLSRFGWGC